MSFKIGQTVKMREGSDCAELLRDAAPLAGKIGDIWTGEDGERVSVVYEVAQVYAYGLLASEFVPAEASP